MLHVMSLSWNISLKDVDDPGEITIRYTFSNLTNPYTSKTYVTKELYYNLNLADFPENVFNNNDICIIKFVAYYKEEEYKATLYYRINSYSVEEYHDVVLSTEWDHNANMAVKVVGNKARVKFMASYYNKIMYELYILTNGKYVLIDSAVTDVLKFSIKLEFSGVYKIAGYVMDNDYLLAYKEQVIEVKDVMLSKYRPKYLEWGG